MIFGLFILKMYKFWPNKNKMSHVKNSHDVMLKGEPGHRACAVRPYVRRRVLSWIWWILCCLVYHKIYKSSTVLSIYKCRTFSAELTVSTSVLCKALIGGFLGMFWLTFCVFCCSVLLTTHGKTRKFEAVLFTLRNWSHSVY